MLPLGILSLAIGGVVSYSVGSNFGLGYVRIDQLPLTAAELAVAHKTQSDQVAAVAEPLPEKVVKSVAPKPEPSQSETAVSKTETPPEPTSTAKSPDVAQSSDEPKNGADRSTESVPNLPEEIVSVSEPEKEQVASPELKPAAQAKANVVQSISVDEEGNEIVRLSVDQIVVPDDSELSELDLPDTADIVARANLAAGVVPTPKDEGLDAESTVDEIVEELENEEVARFSTDPEDLPILRVIIPDKDTADVVVQEAEPEEASETFTEATLSRKITDAVDSGVVSRVLKLIEQGEPLDGKDRAGQTMLLKAAWNGDEEMLDALLALGANVNLSSNDGRTPLFSATVSGNLRLVEKLVELGASVNTKTKRGKTPLMVSAWSNYPDIALYLLEQGAQPDLIDANGRNALFYALWDRNIDVVRTLIQYGARLDQVDTEGHSAVDIARLRRIELPGMDLEAELKSIN